MDFILENLGKIGFEWKMALFNLINFLILFWILKKYFFKPIMKNVRDREQEIQDSVDNIQKAKTELQMAERRAQNIIDQAKVDANKVIEKSHDTAKANVEQIKEKAKKEIEMLILQAKRNIEIDKKEMKELLRKETVEFVILAVEKIIGKKLDIEQDDQLIMDILSSQK